MDRWRASSRAVVDFERLDGPGPYPFAMDLRLAGVRERGEGIWSKSTSEVRGTGREDDPTRFELEGLEGRRELDKYCKGPIM